MKKDRSTKLKSVKLLGKILLPLMIIAFPFLLVAFIISPKFFSRLVRLIFDYQFKIPPKEFLYTDSVKTITNLKYGAADDERLDLHLPNKKQGSYPLILWAHGGAYIAGNKKYLAFFARVLANFGYVVATVDYTLAPESHYPTPLVQIKRAYDFLVSDHYQSKELIDSTRLFLAGDSAGAQIMAQFALLWTNPNYRQAFKIAHRDIHLGDTIPTSTLRGMLLYCGPFALKEIQQTPSKLLKFLFRQTVWAYFGKRRLSNLPALDEVDIISHLTKDFPPSFICDGNTLSFPTHGHDLSLALKALKVPTTTMIFDKSPRKIYHEFQFDLAIPEARQSLLTALAFLKKHRDFTSLE